MREAVLDLFPILRERLKQRSGTLSGGEQQMLAMARALCLEPQVLLLDEPTEGLMPSMIAKIRETVAKLRERGVSTILVEQRVDAVLPVADRVSFIENGRVRETVEVGRLRDEPETGEALCRRELKRSVRTLAFGRCFSRRAASRRPPSSRTSMVAIEPPRSMPRQASSLMLVVKPRPTESSAE